MTDHLETEAAVQRIINAGDAASGIMRRLVRELGDAHAGERDRYMAIAYELAAAIAAYESSR